MASESVVSTVVAAVATIMGGVLAGFVDRRQRRNMARLREEADRIAEVYETEVNARKVVLAESAVDRLPQGLTPQQITALVDEIVRRLPEP